MKDDQRFMIWSSIGELIWGGGFQHGDVKDRVDTSHRVREAEGERDGTNLGYNLKRAEVFFCKFLRGSGSMDVIGLSKDFISNLEVWQWSPMFVHGDRVLFLHVGYV